MKRTFLALIVGSVIAAIIYICLYHVDNTDVYDHINMYDSWVSKLNHLKCTIKSSGNLIEDTNGTLVTNLSESQGKVLAHIRSATTNEGVYMDDKTFRRAIYSNASEEAKLVIDTIKPKSHLHLRHSYHIFTLRNFYDDDGIALKLTDLLNRKIYTIKNHNADSTYDITFGSSTGEHIISLRSDLNYAADKVTHINKKKNIKSTIMAKKWIEAAKGLYLPTSLLWEVEVDGAIDKRSTIDIVYHECNIPFDITAKSLKLYNNCKVHDLISMKCYVVDENGNYLGDGKLADGTKITLSRAPSDDTIIKKKSAYDFFSSQYLYIIACALLIVIAVYLLRKYLVLRHT